MVMGVSLFHLLTFSLISCSEDSTEEDEYANWEERNEAQTNQWAANSALRKIKCYTKDATTTGENSDYIYVEVLETGSGTENPMFTDSVWVAYRGRLIPTTSYPDGAVFDQSYIGDFSWHTADFSKFCVSALVSGFTTALLEMHPGDRWRVHIPYMLGYGTTASSSGTIPAYSDLTFDIALLDFWHPGETRPEFK
ncbi:MAG: FKBP-type peptidyl-prolyl cis-trans isomerase [Prevotella sp.]|nr:FKBP-type peptidyl-prolyl cis-trans isomerase [Prevotella sp.]